MTNFSELSEFKKREKIMPALFLGHGSPEYAIGENPYSQAWSSLGRRLEMPSAVLCISAHWMTKGSHLTGMKAPPTIHDFFGFPDELYRINYPAPGSPDLAAGICNTILNPEIEQAHDWGFDHGCWSILSNMYPDANIPVVQLSLDMRKGPEYHYQLGSQLSFLRKRGVLIIGSGNIVHNLRKIQFPESSKFDWAIEFDLQSKRLIEIGDHQSLIQYDKLGLSAQLSIPTSEHYLPLMYILGLQNKSDAIEFPIEGIAYGSTSMRSVLLGSTN